MRITIHLDSFDSTVPGVWAILWFDLGTRRWSRESHAGMDIPPSGALDFASGQTGITGPTGAQRLGILEDLDLTRPSGPFEGEEGAVLWHHRSGGSTPLHGRWHVQCIDESETVAENGLFAGSE